MNIKQYLKERFLFLFISLSIFFGVMCVLLILNVKAIMILLIFILSFLPLITYIIIEYIKYKRYFNNIEKVLDSLDKKYLLPEIIEIPRFIQGKIFHEVLKKCNKQMHEHVNYYKNEQIEYREYIETWVHEIKTPISSAMLILENNDSHSISKDIEDEMKNIEGLVEQVLYYSRSSDVNKDYLIKKIKLDSIIKNVLKKNSKDFIYKGIKLQLDNIEEYVYSDSKWIQFVINQIINNSIKYINPKKGVISIYSKSNNNNVILTIEDNGIGIYEKDIDRVFEKGFTGKNGRKYAKSTGMGLYICRKLCYKLGLHISITSKRDVGTKVNIIFPLSKHNLLK
ncbi:sensor histidine kinase [Clostridium oceanicum]